MSRPALHLVLSALIVGAAPAVPQRPDAVVQDRVAALFENARTEHGFPGACIAWVRSDGSSGAVAVGFSDAGETEPLTPEAVMFSGSIGKTYVAAVALQLVGEGSLELDGKIASELGEEPWFERLPGGDRITLRMLLSHRSGIPEHVWLPEFQRAIRQQPYRVWEPAELVAYVLDARARFPPGEGFAYADTNYILVGMVLERVTSQSWYDLLRNRLLEPLELRDTHPSDRADIPGLVNGFSTGTGFHEGPTVVDGKYFANPQFEWCGGGVASTALDLARWCRHLFAGDVVPERLRAEHRAGGPESRRIGGRYGLGVIVSRTRHGTAYGHSGIMPGYLSQMVWYPELQLALAIQFNTDDPRQLGRSPAAWLDLAADELLDR